MIPHRWRRNAADNGSADPNADVRPGRSANTVLGIIRGLMASGAASRDDAIGGLVAVLGTGNVYAVGTNEGLVDVATGINGVPAAITAPFLLRTAFDTALAGTAVAAPHLKVDGFDCGPILRRDGSALADGDLPAGVPVLLLGDMAAPTDTKVTRVRVLDRTPSDIAALGLREPLIWAAAGAYTWPCPPGVTRVRIKVSGSGGGGGGNSGVGAAGSGGGYAEGIYAVTPGTTYTVTIGAAGTGSANAPTAGAACSFASPNGVVVQATGGGSTVQSGTGGGSGPGGVGQGGTTLNLTGQLGQDLDGTNTFARGGVAPLGFPGRGGDATSPNAYIGATGSNGEAGMVRLEFA